MIELKWLIPPCYFVASCFCLLLLCNLCANSPLKAKNFLLVGSVLSIRMLLLLLLLSTSGHVSSATSLTQLKHQTTLAISTTTPNPQSEITQSVSSFNASLTVSLGCYITSLKPTSTCRPDHLGVQSCVPTETPILSCNPRMNCLRSSDGSPSCVPRNDKVAPAGIALGIIAAIGFIVMIVFLTAQRLKEKKRRRQAMDDRLQCVPMSAVRSSRKVEVIFVERRMAGHSEEDEDIYDDHFSQNSFVPAPPPYSQDDRKRREQQLFPSTADGRSLCGRWWYHMCRSILCDETRDCGSWTAAYVLLVHL